MLPYQSHFPSSQVFASTSYRLYQPEVQNEFHDNSVDLHFLPTVAHTIVASSARTDLDTIGAYMYMYL